MVFCPSDLKHKRNKEKRMTKETCNAKKFLDKKSHLSLLNQAKKLKQELK